MKKYIIVLLTLSATVVLFAANLADNFSTDPTAGRWIARAGTLPSWDDPNDEFDVVLSNRWGHQFATTPGSMEHEAQITFQVSGSNDGVGGPACRMRNDSTTEWYHLTVNQSVDQFRLGRKETDGTHTLLDTDQAFTMVSLDWVTFRLACAGGSGANVVLSVWRTNHGSTKPAVDPDWIGTDGSPDYTFTDSSAGRHDDTVNEYVGIGGHWSGADYDTRHSYWHGRAIADRAGGGGTTGFGSAMMGVGVK